MARYLATRIEKGKLDYSEVVEKYPKHKEAIDDYLKEDGYGELIQ